MKPTDLAGLVFGRLTVISVATPEPRFCGRVAWRCLCECGATTNIVAYNLKPGGTRSCGCLFRDGIRTHARTHGKSYTREYVAWTAAKTRCYNPRQPGYKNYGGRGIVMSPEWLHSFETFLADMGECPAGHTIERKDGAGPYSKANCVWAPRSVQANNRRNNRVVEFRGRKLTVAQWAREVGMPGDTLKRRFLLGWTAERALTEPLRRW